MPAPAPQAPSAAASPAIPPELTDLKIEAKADPRLENYAGSYDEYLKNLKEGRTREAELFNQEQEDNIERQVAAMREQAQREGRPFDEESARAELARHANKAKADFALGTQKETGEALRGGLDIERAPFESEMAGKGLSLETQKLLSNFAIARGGLMNEAERNALMARGQAMDAYRIMLEAMLRLA
jgi:ATPase subunit of ABC transporter with duplicated ATPase domains